MEDKTRNLKRISFVNCAIEKPTKEIANKNGQEY